MSSRRLTPADLEADERGVFRRVESNLAAGARKARQSKKAHDSLGNSAIDLAWKMFRVVMRKTNAEAIAVCVGTEKNGSKRWAKRPSGLTPGWLDYTMFIQPTGHPVFVDAKTGAKSKKKGQGLRPKQVEFIEQVKAVGCSVIVLTDLDKFIEELGVIVDREQRKNAVLAQYGGYQENAELKAKL